MINLKTSLLLKILIFLFSVAIFSFTPTMATASICNDGSLSPSTGQGTCSHHGGVRQPYVIVESSNTSDDDSDGNLAVWGILIGAVLLVSGIKSKNAGGLRILLGTLLVLAAALYGLYLWANTNNDEVEASQTTYEQPPMQQDMATPPKLFMDNVAAAQPNLGWASMATYIDTSGISVPLSSAIGDYHKSEQCTANYSTSVFTEKLTPEGKSITSRTDYEVVDEETAIIKYTDNDVPLEVSKGNLYSSFDEYLDSFTAVPVCDVFTTLGSLSYGFEDASDSENLPLSEGAERVAFQLDPLLMEQHLTKKGRSTIQKDNETYVIVDVYPGYKLDALYVLTVLSTGDTLMDTIVFSAQ